MRSSRAPASGGTVTQGGPERQLSPWLWAAAGRWSQGEAGRVQEAAEEAAGPRLPKVHRWAGGTGKGGVREWAAEGGMGAVSDAIAKSAESAGAEIVTEATVKKVW